MSSMATRQREQIRLKAQRLREAESSRHDITKLAYELLLKCIDERHAANGRTSFEERARVDSEHLSNTAKLVVAHEHEDIKFEDAMIAMIAEFDSQRDKLLGASLAKKLEENKEGLRHTKLLESLRAKLTLDDQEAEQELQKTVERCQENRWITCGYCDTWNGWKQGTPNTTCCSCGQAGLNFGTIAEVIQARAQAQHSTTARHKVYEELVDHHKAQWELYQEALRLEIINNRKFRRARLDLEYAFQLRFAEHYQRRNAIQQRHAEEFTELENKRISTLAAVLLASEHAEEKLHEERRRVEGWWRHLCKEAEAGLRRIDDEEQTALGDFDCQEIPLALDTEREDQTVETENDHDELVDLLDKVKHQESAEVAVVDGKEEAIAARHKPDKTAPDTNPRDPTVSLTADSRGPDDSVYTSSNNVFHSGLVQPSILRADEFQVSVVSSARSSHTPAIASPFDPLFDLAFETVTPPDTHDKSNLIDSASYTGPAGSVPSDSGSSNDGDSESDFVEI